MKWFRLYYEAIDDEKLRLLAFEDRWHYIAILCLKSSGILDQPISELRDRKIALKLGLTVREAEEVKRRLFEVGLISKNYQPKNWDKRQYVHDSSAERTRQYRARQKIVIGHSDSNGDVTVTTTDTDTDTEREKGKRFSPPTQGLVFDYMLSQGMSKSEAKTQSNKFVNFYQSKAWLVGKTKMKDWEAAVRNNWLEKGPKEERRPYEISGPPDCPKCRRTMFKNHTCEAA